MLGSSVSYQSEVDPLSPCNSTHLKLPSPKGFLSPQTASGLSAGKKPMMPHLLHHEKMKIYSDGYWQL